MDADEIHTPRLLLKQLQTNDAGTQDLEWFHHVWSNDQATQWSYHGPCKTREESQKWMAGVLPRNAMGSEAKIAVAVLCKLSGDTAAPHNSDDDWEAAGIITLLQTDFKLPTEEPPEPDSSSKNTAVKLGYLFHPASWGKGYATESLLEFLRVYQEESEARKRGVRVHICGNVHGDNVKSLRVMEKLGFEEVGRYKQEGRLPLREDTTKDTVVHFRMKH
ncbi:hypothetical protein TOPH_06497 [Tolypocladium ophioglossoides CBS 100239]|uniref:N-acetyltransferase domain-containing protein n=1 Tax=Tolypocladium ophioglossoides (strain CBS 100239) TaxID=1163406 RepID=A0A0L0N486_TOLOC|nr:hypothetical protein TOPH_06497 [Tolypocladium ophioglossoides CBS 100239]